MFTIQNFELDSTRSLHHSMQSNWNGKKFSFLTIKKSSEFPQFPHICTFSFKYSIPRKKRNSVDCGMSCMIWMCTELSKWLELWTYKNKRKWEKRHENWFPIKHLSNICSFTAAMFSIKIGKLGKISARLELKQLFLIPDFYFWWNAPNILMLRFCSLQFRRVYECSDPIIIIMYNVGLGSLWTWTLTFIKSIFFFCWSNQRVRRTLTVTKSEFPYIFSSLCRVLWRNFYFFHSILHQHFHPLKTYSN